MKRFYISLLLAALCLSTFATIKPRYQGWRADWTPGMLPTSEMSDQPMHMPRRVGLHSNAPLTSMGSPKVPVILVQFPDLKFTAGLPAGQQCETEEDCDLVGDYFDLFCNGLRDDAGYWTEGGSMGAIREYFRDQSDGLFTPDFTIIGPVTLDNSYAFYGKNSGTRKDININTFYTEAITKAQQIYSNWNIFDNNNDGTVDMAFFVFAGPGENAFNLKKNPEAVNYIWPKEQASGGTLGSVKYGCYACCNETYKNKPDGIGVFVHELSHAMGLPDLYDYNYLAYGMDYWDIMDSGCYCNDGYTPCNYSAYEKDFMGWLPLNTLNFDEPQHLLLNPMHAGGVAYKIVNPDNANEYYVLENRQTGGWDTYIGKGTDKTKIHGMLITHINYSQSSWTSNRLNSSLSSQRCTIIPADGVLDSYMNVTSSADLNIFYPSVLGDPFPGNNNVTEWEGTDSIDMPYWTTAKIKVEDRDTIVDTLMVQQLPAICQGKYNQPLRNIVENADGTIELDYCPGGQVPTAITEFAATEPRRNDETLYDMQGRPVQHATRGLYIRNGRKYLFR